MKDVAYWLAVAFGILATSALFGICVGKFIAHGNPEPDPTGTEDLPS